MCGSLHAQGSGCDILLDTSSVNTHHTIVTKQDYIDSWYIITMLVGCRIPSTIEVSGKYINFYVYTDGKVDRASIDKRKLKKYILKYRKVIRKEKA